MKLSIIIVSWNVREDLIRCLRSVEENQPSGEFETIIIDNGSTDGTVEAVKRSFPEVVVLTNSENCGFAAANNQGIEIAKGQYILLLNPDTIVHSNSIDQLIDFMDNNLDIGVCGPKLLNADGTTQGSVRQFPTFRAALYRHTIFKVLLIFRKQQHRYMMRHFSYDRQMDVDQVTGAAFMTRKSIVDQIGAMDEQFFMYYEEVDFCYRVNKAGYRIVFTPTAAITHFGGQSSGQIPIENRMMLVKSMLMFFRKHRGRFVTGLFNVLFKPAVILRDINNIAVGCLMYVLATLLANQRRRLKAVTKIKRSSVWLGKYSWQLLFKM